MQHTFAVWDDPKAAAAAVRSTGAAIIRAAAPPKEWATTFVDRIEEVGRGKRDGALFTTHYVIGASSIDLIGPEVSGWFFASPWACSTYRGS